MGVVKWFKGLQPAIKIVIVLVVVFLLFRAFKYAKGYLKASGEQSELQGEIDFYVSQGMKLTHPKALYESWANDLQTAMAGPGANSIAVYNIFKKMENDLDILELNRVFGVRSSFMSSAANLRGWLKEETMISIEKINNILSGKGITKLY